MFKLLDTITGKHLKGWKFATRAEAATEAHDRNTKARARRYKVVTTTSWFIVLNGESLITDATEYPAEYPLRQMAKRRAEQLRKLYCGQTFEVVKSPKGMRACMWSFGDDDETFIGFTDDTYWNGFLNIWVSPKVHEKNVADCKATSDDDDDHVAFLEGLTPDKNGLICYAMGMTTCEVRTCS